MSRKGLRGGARAAPSAGVALWVLARPLVALAETGPTPAGGGSADQGFPSQPVLLVAALLIAAVVIVIPRARRPIAAVLLAGSSMVVASWIVVIGAWSRSTSGGGLPAEAVGAAAGVAVLGLLVATWVLLAGRRNDRDARRG